MGDLTEYNSPVCGSSLLQLINEKALYCKETSKLSLQLNVAKIDAASFLFVRHTNFSCDVATELPLRSCDS